MSSAQHEEPVEKTQIGSCEVTLLGTAHISRASADKVRELLLAEEFDSVAVELCYSRHRAIIDPDALAKMDLFQVIREGKATMVAASLALGAFQQRMAEKLDIKPGAEMRTAIDIAEQKDMPVLLIDREIGTTLKRVYRSVRWWQRMNLITGLMVSVVSRHEVSEEEIERLKEGDILESTFTQFAEEAKELYAPLVDERDQFMAARLIQEVNKGKYHKMLVVIGAGHLKGTMNYLHQWQGRAHGTTANAATTDDGNNAGVFDPSAKIKSLNYIASGSRWPKVIPWLIVLLILTGFLIGFLRSPSLGWELVSEWVFINGGLAAIGAILALAHPITVFSAFIAAPITSLNPTIGAGMVTAAIETILRKPKVEDFARLRSDTTNVLGWWRNRVTRVLLVFIFSTVGSAAGTYLAGYRIFEKLSQ